MYIHKQQHIYRYIDMTIQTVVYFGEKPHSLEEVQRKFIVDGGSVDYIDFKCGWHAERQSAGWALISPKGRRMATHGWLELS
jgi:hypothetical protein